MIQNTSRLLRVGVFYDGNYFLHVSNYYNFSHTRRSRISIQGLHEFVRHEVAQLEGVAPHHAQVVDAHYFRGRMPAQEAKQRNKLLSERLFEDILMKEGVITHFLPYSQRGEKSIDVWLALEALEMAFVKKYDVLVLIACDSDYVPLVRKLNGMGTRVMVLGWDFEYTDEFGNKRATVTSAALMKECSYPVRMADAIDGKTGTRSSTVIDGLFVPREIPGTFTESIERSEPTYAVSNGTGNGYKRSEERSQAVSDERLQGRVQNVKEGYGFIETSTPGRNLFFYWEDVDGDFHDLRIGDLVEYSTGFNHRGECAVEVAKITDPEAIANAQQTLSATVRFDD